MFINANKKWQFWLEIVMVVFGTVIMGFAFSIFLEPNEISTGGFSALSMVINALFGKIGLENISTSIIYLVLNIGLYLFALKTLGKRFAIKALIGIISFSLSMELFTYIHFNITFELLVSAIYGGAIMGAGVGLVVRFGGSTGGSDMIACITRKKKPNATIGTLMICIDAVIILLSTITFSNGVGLLPYTIIALIISMLVTDFINDGYKQVRAFNIITTKPEILADAIMTKLARGCTCTQVKGMHSKTDRYQLVCLASRFQMSQLKNIIKELDPEAFVYLTKVPQVIGIWSTVEEIQKETEISPKPKKSQAKTNKKVNKTVKNTKQSKTNNHEDSINLSEKEISNPETNSNDNN